MYHSITFGDKNTWDDWHLVPSSRPLFNPPTVKTKIIDIPGANGNLDLSDSLTKYPVYNNREGQLEFIVMNDYWEWYDAYSTIMNYLHGQTMKAILEDDQEWYYIGRFSVNSWKSSKDYSRIVIDYSVKPFKYFIRGTLENWLWDPFNFKTGIIPKSIFGNITIEGSKTLEFTQKDYGGAPACPKFIVNTGMSMRFINPYMGIDKIVSLYTGMTNQFEEFLFYGPSVKIVFSLPTTPLLDSQNNYILDSKGNQILGVGAGSVSIEFDKGGL